VSYKTFGDKKKNLIRQLFIQ